MQQKIAAVLFIALGAFAANYARGLRMYTGDGPGAGLFPLIVGIGLVLMGALWFVQLVIEGERDGTATASGPMGWLRVGLQIGSLLLFSFLLEPLGYITSAAVLVVLTALIAGERNWFWMAVVAAICSWGVQYSFGLLGTQL